MNNQNIIIYQFPILYQILKELDLDLNLNIFKAENEELLKNKVKDLKNYLVVSKKKISHTDHQLIFNFKPIKIFKLVEHFNVYLIKNNFNDQSNKFELNQYKKDIEKNLINIISENLIIKLQSL